MSIVLDSSMTLSWYFEDERTPISRALLDEVVRNGAIVPSLWRFEVANGLQLAVRRKRISATYRDETLADLDALQITIDPESDDYAWSISVRLAERHALTVYDAVYLELAQRRRLRLATLDKALLKAARAEIITTIGPNGAG